MVLFSAIGSAWVASVVVAVAGRKSGELVWWLLVVIGLTAGVGVLVWSWKRAMRS